MNDFYRLNAEMKDNSLFIEIEGSITFKNFKHLQEEISNLTKENKFDKIVFNLKNLRHMNSSCVPIILNTTRDKFGIKQNYKDEVIILHNSEVIEKILKLFGDEYFTIKNF